VVVKPAQIDLTADRDPDLVKLQSIPMFLPIMRGTLNLPPGVRDPEVLERLDPVGLFNLCARYQHHLNTNAQTIAAEQTALCTNMEVELGKAVNLAVDRQKRFARFAEQLNKVHELSRQLTRCHSLLNQTLESLEMLNNLLPVEERLEPFVWTTGWIDLLNVAISIIDFSHNFKKNLNLIMLRYKENVMKKYKVNIVLELYRALKTLGRYFN